MDHNEFDFNEDLVDPFRDFLKQLRIDLSQKQGESALIKFPEELYLPPTSQLEHEQNNKSSSSLWYWIIRKFKW